MYRVESKEEGWGGACGKCFEDKQHATSSSAQRKEGGRSWTACLSVSITRSEVRKGMLMHTHTEHATNSVQEKWESQNVYVSRCDASSARYKQMSHVIQTLASYMTATSQVTLFFLYVAVHQVLILRTLMTWPLRLTGSSVFDFHWRRLVHQRRRGRTE